MPKTLSPTPYVPFASGTGSTACIASGPSLNTVSSVSITGRPSPSASPVTVSALSQYSSSTAGLLDELQICGLDSPGASPTPSPTLSLVSAYTSTAGPDDALTASVASTAAAATVTNVIIPISHCCNTHCLQRQVVPLSYWCLNQTTTKLYYYQPFPLTINYNFLHLYPSDTELNSAHYVMVMCSLALCVCVVVCNLLHLFCVLVQVYCFEGQFKKLVSGREATAE